VVRSYVAYYLPPGDGRMVVAEVLDFPGAVSKVLISPTRAA